MILSCVKEILLRKSFFEANLVVKHSVYCKTESVTEESTVI